MKTWPTTNGCAYVWSSTVSVNTLPNCCTLTLLVVNAVSLSFQPDLVLSLCCVSTDTDCGFGGPTSVGFSLHVASNSKTNTRVSLRSTIDGAPEFLTTSANTPPDRSRPHWEFGRDTSRRSPPTSAPPTTRTRRAGTATASRTRDRRPSSPLCEVRR